MVDFLKKVVDVFQVGPDSIRFAAIAYSTNAVVEFTFDTLRGSNINKAGYKNLLDSITRQRGYTFIDRALHMANSDIFTTSNGMRPNVQKVQFDNNLFIYSFIHSFIYLFIHSFIYSFIHSFIYYLFIYLFIAKCKWFI